MRVLLIVPLAVVLATAAALAVCGACGVAVSWGDALWAAAVCTVATELAFAPMAVARRIGRGSVSQFAAAQAALAGTMVHLFVTFAAACVLVLSGSGLRAPFLVWVTAMYGLTLALIVAVLVRWVRSASDAKAGGASGFGLAQATQNTKP